MGTVPTPTGLPRRPARWPGPVLATGLLMGSTAVLGHGTLLRAEPGDGVVLDRSPQRVRAWFDSELEAATSSLTVFDAGGRAVEGARGGVDLDDAEHASLVLTLPKPLPRGRYSVHWRTTSAEDGDRNEGWFGFEVR